jgi:hypothetical protein
MPFSYLRKRFQVKKSVFPWKPATFGAQDHVPVELNLHSKIGISKGSKVHVFAGYYGNWTHALADEVKRVRYTDASKEFTSIAKERGAKNVSYKTIAAELAPVRRNAFDWSFSFEPFPLLGHKGIFQTTSRSLLNKKGLKVLFSEREKDRGKDLIEAISFIAGIYKAKLSTKKIRLSAVKTSDKLNDSITFPRIREFSVVTLLTNPLARENVFLDLRVQNLVDKAIKKSNPSAYNREAPLTESKKEASTIRTQKKDFEFAVKMIPVLSKQLKVTPNVIKESLDRLRKLSELYAKVN